MTPSPIAYGGDQVARVEPRAKRAPVQLVQGVGRDPDGEEESDQGREQAGDMDRRGEAGTDHDIGQVPCRVRRVQDEPPVAPTASASGIEGRSHRSASRRVGALVSHRLSGPT